MFLIRPIQLIAICLFLGLSLPAIVSGAPNEADIADAQLQLELLQKQFTDMCDQTQATCDGVLPAWYCKCGSKNKPCLLDYSDTLVLEQLLVTEGIFNTYVIDMLKIKDQENLQKIKAGIENLRTKCGSGLSAFRQHNGLEKTQNFMNTITKIKQNVQPKYLSSKIQTNNISFWCQTNATGGYIDGQPVFECMGSQHRCNNNAFTAGQCKKQNSAYCFMRNSTFGGNHYACAASSRMCRLWQQDDLKRGNAKSTCSSISHKEFTRVNGAE
jgi:hypothetical protein